MLGLLVLTISLTLPLALTGCADAERDPAPAAGAAGTGEETTVAPQGATTSAVTTLPEAAASAGGANPSASTGGTNQSTTARDRADTTPQASSPAQATPKAETSPTSTPATAPSSSATPKASPAGEEAGASTPNEPTSPATVRDGEDGPEPAASSTPREAAPSRPRYRAGEDPDFAARMGWPVEGPEPLPGALLPHNRIVAYYGNPLSRRMGVLGEYDPEEMLERLDRAVIEWAEADPATPVVPALHLIAVVAQADSGSSGKYRLRMRDSLIERVAEWAETRNALVFLDVQVGLSTLEEELPRLLPFLKRPNFHLGIDPEFSMKDGTPPGKRIGTFDAADINYATGLLAEWVREYDLPPKILVVHRFTRRMVTNSKDIVLRPEVQIVMHMDGWGAAWLKRDSYRDFIVREPVQFAGFKIFYHNDVRQEGWRLMTPEEVLRLRPVPVYIQYQ